MLAYLWGQPERYNAEPGHVGGMAVQVIIHADGKGLTGAAQDAAQLATIDGLSRNNANAALLPAGETAEHPEQGAPD